MVENVVGWIKFGAILTLAARNGEYTLPEVVIQILVPASMHGALVSFTESCIAVGTRAEDDGETEIILQNESHISMGDQLAHEGKLKIPSRTIVVRSVFGVVLLEMPVVSFEAYIRIWVNDSREPDRIVIGVKSQPN